jgi:hypothetical protein
MQNYGALPKSQGPRSEHGARRAKHIQTRAHARYVSHSRPLLKAGPVGSVTREWLSWELEVVMVPRQTVYATFRLPAWDLVSVVAFFIASACCRPIPLSDLPLVESDVLARANGVCQREGECVPCGQ